MIDALSSDDLIRKMGGRFKLTALIQKRMLEIMQGARPMVEPEGLTPMEVVVEEIVRGYVDIDWGKSENLVQPVPGKE